MVASPSDTLGGEGESVTNRFLKYAGGLFLLALLSIPTSFALAGELRGNQPETADIIAVSIGGGLFALAIGIAILAAYRNGGYVASTAISGAVPLAVTVLYVVASVLDELVTDVQTWIVLTFLVGGSVLLGILTYAIGTSIRKFRRHQSIA